MARLLVIEGWVGSTGVALPRTIVELGHEFVLVTRDPALYDGAWAGEGRHPLLELAADVVTAETNDDAALLDVVAARHRVRRFDGVLTCCDYYLPAASRVAARLGLPGAPPHAAGITRDKHRVRQAIDRAGLPNPAFALVPDGADVDAAGRAIGYPLVAKPVDLHSGALVRKVSAADELGPLAAQIQHQRHNSRRQALRRAVLVEEYLTGPEVSVETVTCAGRTSVVGITDKSLAAGTGFVESGHMVPAGLDGATASAVVDLVRAALEAVGYVHGPAHTEVKLTPDGPRIVEINGRYAGNHIADLVHLVHGTDLPRALVQLALGEQPTLGDGDTGVDSAAVAFVMSRRDAVLDAAVGADGLQASPHVARAEIHVAPGEPVRAPRDNGDYLGHVLTVDRGGLRARWYAQEAVAGLRLHYDDGRELAPVAVALDRAA